MRITLVHPAGYNFVPGQPDLTILANRMAPVGILQLSAWLDRLGHTTFVHDCLGPWAPSGAAKNADLVLATNPDLVGFSTTTSGFLDGCEMAARIKRKDLGVKTIFGGAHISAIGAPLLRHFPQIDYLCVGEGEGLMEDLAGGKPLNEIGNLVYRDGEEIIANPRRPRMAQLDDLPFPSYHKLPGFPKKYHLPLFSYIKRHGATMITSRGCPYTCSYCDRTVFERLYRCNSAEYVWEHMRRLRGEFGVRHIHFYDDLFTASRPRVAALCELLARKPLGMDFNCAIRVDQIDDELLRMLKRAGCLQVSMGVESADPGMMARHKRGVALDAVRDIVARAHAAGLRAKGLFIFGLPGETLRSIQATSDFIEAMDFDDINITKFTPFHGAPIWDECVSGAEGVFHEDWRLMNCINFTFVPKAFASKEQMDRLYSQYVQRFYAGTRYRRRFVRRLWEHRWSLWHMLKHLPAFVRATGQFSVDEKQPPVPGEWSEPHPAQPKALKILPRRTASLEFDPLAMTPQLTPKH